MAIQLRRGAYGDFDPTKMLPGEVAVVQSGDTENSSNGKTAYLAFGNSTVKRIATEDDVTDINNSITEVLNIVAEDEAEILDTLTGVNTALTSVGTTATSALTKANEVDNKISQLDVTMVAIAECTTSGDTKTKSVTISNYELSTNDMLVIRFQDYVPNDAKLSVNSGTAYDIYFNGSNINNRVIKEGVTALLVFTGTVFEVLSLDSFVRNALISFTLDPTYSDYVEINVGRTDDVSPSFIQFPSATTQYAGVMSASDKTKLNGIPSDAVSVTVTNGVLTFS